MLLLTGASDVYRVITSAAVAVDHVAHYMTWAGTTAEPVPGRSVTATTTAATTTVVPAPGAGLFRTVKSLSHRNKSPTTATDVTVQLFDGTTAYDVFKVNLPAGYSLNYDEGRGWTVKDAFGRDLTNAAGNSTSAAVNALNLVVLAADVTNNNATANTIADVTGLSFPVVAGEGYHFRFTINYTAAATTTGSRFSVSGPLSPTFFGANVRVTLGVAGTSGTDVFTETAIAAYDTPAASSASSATATAGQVNIAEIRGFIQPSANGTVIARFASEVASSAIIARRGSLLEWYRVF